MKKVDAWFRSRVSSTHLKNKRDHHHQGSASGEEMENPESNSVNVNSSVIIDQETTNSSTGCVNIVENHDFSQDLHAWHCNCCDGFVASSGSCHPEEISAKARGNYAVLTNRKEPWQGLEQDITNKISPGSTYLVDACVGVWGSSLQGSADVRATLKLEYKDSATKYFCIGGTSVSNGRWGKLEGTFSLATLPDRVVFYLEGPSPGLDLLVESVMIIHSISSEPVTHSSSSEPEARTTYEHQNIILNPSFEDGLKNWSGRSCKIVLHDSLGDRKVVPQCGNVFAAATKRTQSWNGIQQDITGKVKRKLAYNVTAVVRIFGNNVTSSDVRITLWVQSPNHREEYISVACLQATDKDWVQLKGKFLLNGSPSKVVIYLEGPPPGTDILLNSLFVKRAEKIHRSLPPAIEKPEFGVNIIENSNLSNGTKGWFPMGNCTLATFKTGSPRELPPMARASLGEQGTLSGRYICVTNRTETWMGPGQMITEKVKLFSTYQVSAWVRTGAGATGPQIVNVALSVDGQWVNGGQVGVNDDRWHEIGGSFRIEKQPSKVMVYVSGPSPGVDLMLAGLQIFPVDRRARFEHLKRQTEQIRKRDVVLKFKGINPSKLQEAQVTIQQTQNSFPFGSCMMRSNLDNEDFIDFFLKNFNWAVFGNELKWYSTESSQGNLNYKEADEMLQWCEKHNIPVRGHCIFWEVEDTVQPWIQQLNEHDLRKAVENRLTGLLSRYKGRFRHYDVNNEMLHGSFYESRLGNDIRADMFRKASMVDKSATLFVNDYHVEDGCDTKSSPEKYIEQVLDLQEQGAPVGGIGIQGHVDSPVGAVICSALDKLGVLGLPIWFTEVDVSSVNEHVRADDLEVVLRECYAHPAVEGVVLWGFWEMFMSRGDAHLVDAEGEVNEAGMRYVALKREWMSRAVGRVDGREEFGFRGFHGRYSVEIVAGSERVLRTFVVEKGVEPQVVFIDL